MKDIICHDCYHNNNGNCYESCSNYMNTDPCDKYLENEDIGPVEEDLGEDFLNNGIS